MEFIARRSNHIKDDIERNWSSWNFGEGGFNGTYNQLLNKLNEAKQEQTSIFLSGFDLWVEKIKNNNGDLLVNDEFDIRQLYKNYWVIVDNVNARHGLSGLYLKSNNLVDAIKEANKRTDYFGQGDSFDANDATLVYSNGDIHIFEI